MTTPTAQSGPSAENASMVGRKVEVARGPMKGLQGTVLSCEVISGYTTFTVKFSNGQTIPEIPGTALFVHPEQPLAGAMDADPTSTLSQHCQNGRADVCRASQRDGIVCPPDSCDIDDGYRKADATQPAATGAGESSHSWCDYVQAEYKATPAITLGESNIARYVKIGRMCEECGKVEPNAAATGMGDAKLIGYARELPTNAVLTEAEYQYLLANGQGKGMKAVILMDPKAALAAQPAPVEAASSIHNMNASDEK